MGLLFVLLAIAAALIGMANIIGPVLLGDGNTPATGRQAKTGETSVSQVHGKYYEPASRAVLFCASDQGAGVATTTTISTTAILSVYNPLNSGKRIAIKKVSAGYISGTLGAGTIYHCINPMPGANAQLVAPSGGTALKAYCTNVGNVSGAAAVAVVGTGTTVVAPVTLRPFGSLFAELATTANGFQTLTEDVDGEIILEPGGCYQLQSKCAAGTSPLISPGVTWEEVPLVSSQG